MKQPVLVPGGEKACIFQRMCASHITRPRPSALSKAQPFWPYLPPAPFVATPSLACAQATWEYLWSLEAAPQFVLACVTQSLVWSSLWPKEFCPSCWTQPKCQLPHEINSFLHPSANPMFSRN